MHQSPQAGTSTIIHGLSRELEETDIAKRYVKMTELGSFSTVLQDAMAAVDVPAIMPFPAEVDLMAKLQVLKSKFKKLYIRKKRKIFCF